MFLQSIKYYSFVNKNFKLKCYKNLQVQYL